MTRCFLAEPDVPKYLWQEAFRIAADLENRVPSTPLRGKTHFSMWHGGTPPRLEHLRTFGARTFVLEERYVKKLTWEGRMVGYGKDSKTSRIWESGGKIVQSRNVTFIETLPVKLNVFDHDHNDGNDDIFHGLTSSSVSLDTVSYTHLTLPTICSV